MALLVFQGVTAIRGYLVSRIPPPERYLVSRIKPAKGTSFPESQA